MIEAPRSENIPPPPPPPAIINRGRAEQFVRDILDVMKKHRLQFCESLYFEHDWPYIEEYDPKDEAEIYEDLMVDYEERDG